MKRALIPLGLLLLAALVLVPSSYAAEASHAGPSLGRAGLADALNLTPAAAAISQPGGAFALWLSTRSGPVANPSAACPCLGTPCSGGKVCCFYQSPSGLTGCLCTPSDICYGT